MYSHTIYTLYTLSLYVYIHDASLTAYQTRGIRHPTVLTAAFSVGISAPRHPPHIWVKYSIVYTVRLELGQCGVYKYSMYDSV